MKDTQRTKSATATKSTRRVMKSVKATNSAKASKKYICSFCGCLSSGPYKRLWKLDNKLFCRECATKTYGYEEVLNRLSKEEGFTCDFCHEKRVIGFNTPPSNKVIGGKTKCGICFYKGKNVECCEILSLFASHAKKNIRDKDEEKWFNDFTFRFFEALAKRDKLCSQCLYFYKSYGD